MKDTARARRPGPRDWCPRSASLCLR